MRITAIPKVELHSHLELCVRHSTLRELAAKVGMPVDDDQDFRDRFLILSPMKDLGSVLRKFFDTQKVLDSEKVLERVAFEVCEDSFRLTNTRVLELRYSPTFIRMGHEHMSFEQIHQAILQGVQRAEREFPMAVGLICTLQRILSVTENEQVLKFCLKNKNSFIGIDLADNEVGFDSKPFASLFREAKEAGLGVTVHSGEANVPKAAEFVRDAIDCLGAQRIGHGVQIHKSPEMIDYVKARNIVLELCPTSNVLTQAVSSYDEHPLAKLHRAGVLVTLNTDDRGIFNIDLNSETRICVKNLGMTLPEIQRVNDVAFYSSFIAADKKARVYQPSTPNPFQ